MMLARINANIDTDIIEKQLMYNFIETSCNLHYQQVLYSISAGQGIIDKCNKLEIAFSFDINSCECHKMEIISKLE